MADQDRKKTQVTEKHLKPADELEDIQLETKIIEKEDSISSDIRVMIIGKLDNPRL